MKKVLLVENNCCGSDFKALFLYLKSRFGDDTDIKLINLSHAKNKSSLKNVYDALRQLGDDILPAIFVNDVLVSSSYVPNVMEATVLVETEKPTANSLRSANASGGSCCG
ncbi:MAG: arsenic metallochaperone ArsD family protein [Oscillospiraceae bacterium]|nr:arsenic metallochaperone ArsD family protein [Oscillospiraceae bacterium]